MTATRLILSSLLFAGLAGCGASTAPEAGAGSGSNGSGDSVRFIVVGDTGTGPSGLQYDVAKVMEQVCAQRGCDFAIVTGDNIYERGVSSVSDSQFDTAFRTPYANLKFPFFIALGNHDNTGNTIAGDGSDNAKGDFQVDYNYSSANTDGQWTMPDRYYAFTWPRNSTTPVADFVAIDASPITHFVNDTSAQWSGDRLATYIADQKAFVGDRLSTSKARWRFAFAHHPYISNGQHGNAGSFESGASPDTCSVPLIISDTCRGADYKAFLEATMCDRADVFFTGHDHNLYWLQPTAACGKTQFILSGAGAKTRGNDAPDRNPTYFQVGDISGFYWVELRGDTFYGAAYTQTGGVSTQVDSAGKPLPVFERSFQRSGS